MLLSLWHSKTASFFLSIIFTVTEVSPSKRSSSVWIAMSLFSIFIHQNTKSTTVLCIYNILDERLKAPSKISNIDVDSGYHQEAKTIKFIYLLISCRETSQGRPNSVLKEAPRTPIWKYITKHITAVFFSILLHHMCCVKYWKISCSIFIQFWRTVLWTSSKHSEKTSIG